jgi:hypothetical protein
MIMKVVPTSLVLFFLCFSSVGAPFRNLGFDEANTNTTQFFTIPDSGFPPLQGFGPPQDLVPGWQLYDGTNPITSVGYNLVSTNGTRFTLLSRDVAGYVEGSFALLSYSEHIGILEPLSLVQRAEIPADARFLWFTSSGFKYSVELNGIQSLVIRDFSGDRIRSFVDVSAFAGQNVELRISTLESIARIDSLVFVIPEASTYSLFGLGSLVLLIPWCQRWFEG